MGPSRERGAVGRILRVMRGLGLFMMSAIGRGTIELGYRGSLGCLVFVLVSGGGCSSLFKSEDSGGGDGRGPDLHSQGAIEMQKAFDAASWGQWEAKAQIKDRRRNSSQAVNLDLIADKSQSLRLEVSGPLGISLAALSIHHKNMEYLIYPQKKYFRGDQEAEVQVPPLGFSPKMLFHLCWERPLQGEEGWSCNIHPSGDRLKNYQQGVKQGSRTGSRKFLRGEEFSICENKEKQVKVVWEDRIPSSLMRRVQISTPTHHVQIVFKKFTPKDSSQISDQTFVLKVPESFSQVSVME